MPTYEYACKRCGQHIEVVQSFRDDPLTECAVCGGPLRKVFGSIGITFKGSGFYKTDSRGSKLSSSTKSDKADSKADSKSDSKADSKSDSKADSGSSSDSSSSSTTTTSGAKTA